MHRKLKLGQKPHFKKKCKRKLLLQSRRFDALVLILAEKHLDKLVEKFEELKKTNKLQKYMQKRSKKLAGKRLKRLGGDLDL